MLDPRSATSRGVRPQQLHHGERVVDRARPEAAVGFTVAARVVGERRHPVRTAAASEVEVALLRRAAAVQDHDSRVRLALR